jgi:hypothetical protein
MPRYSRSDRRSRHILPLDSADRRRWIDDMCYLAGSQDIDWGMIEAHATIADDDGRGYAEADAKFMAIRTSR